MEKSKHAFNKKLCFLLQNKPNLTIKQYIHILSSIYETSINTDVKITLGKKKKKCDFIEIDQVYIGGKDIIKMSSLK